jgi:hypothetical protein
MIAKLAIVPLAVCIALVPMTSVLADDPPASSTSSSSTSPTGTSTSAATTTTKKPQASDIINGKVDKISENSITLKVTYQTGGKPTHHHANVAHVGGSWLPHIVPGPAPHPNHKAKVHTVTRTMTFEIGEIPPVKVVTDGPHPTRTTGAYSDVKVGDLVMVGTRAVSVKDGEGKGTNHTQVTGIDVLKHPGTQSTTPATPAKPPQN